jgi:CRISPR-associated protein Csm1
MDDRGLALIDYGICLFSTVVSQDGQELRVLAGNPPQVAWPAYESALGSPRPGEEFLSSILARVNLGRPAARDQQTTEGYLLPQPLDLGASNRLEDSPLYPRKLEIVRAQADLETLWQRFEGEAEALLKREGPDETDRFERFFYLFRKYAWALPCSYGEPGVSLFEQWKAIAALVFASGDDWKTGPASSFTLVGGDIPGIQDFVFTITSKGAAKGLRGRSFFVQLLGEAVIQRVLNELHLSTANVIYAAGGNFMLLAPAEDQRLGDSTIGAALQALRLRIEEALLDEFQGDLGAALEWTPLLLNQIGNAGFANQASRVLKEKIAVRKRQRFASLVGQRWEMLFEPQGRPGDGRCEICQRSTGEHNGERVGESTSGEPIWRCHTCEGFRDLAERIGKRGDLVLELDRRAPAPGAPRWQSALYAVSGLRYTLRALNRDRIESAPASSSRRYLINDADFVGKGCAGFRYWSNVTPHVTQEDIVRWEEQHGQEQYDEEEKPRLGDIRSFSQMADASQGVKRVGVLRMDVDDLGQVMVSGLAERSMAATSALSWSLDLFFGGWLNRACERVQRPQAGDALAPGERLYVIYAGGDDLFVVGSWDLMPELAQAIHADFTRYACRNPSLTISGGITLEGRKFPLYQAAEQAGQVEELAKRYTWRG